METEKGESYLISFYFRPLQVYLTPSVHIFIESLRYLFIRLIPRAIVTQSRIQTFKIVSTKADFEYKINVKGLRQQLHVKIIVIYITMESWNASLLFVSIIEENRTKTGHRKLRWILIRRVAISYRVLQLSSL